MWLSTMTAKEYAELKLFCQMEPLPYEKISIALGVSPEDLNWTPNEQDDEEMIRLLEMS